MLSPSLSSPSSLLAVELDTGVGSPSPIYDAGGGSDGGGGEAGEAGDDDDDDDLTENGDERDEVPMAPAAYARVVGSRGSLGLRLGPGRVRARSRL